MPWRLNCRQVNPCSLPSEQEKTPQTLHFPHAQQLDGYWHALPAPPKEEQNKDICMAIFEFVAYCSEFKGKTIQSVTGSTSQGCAVGGFKAKG